MVLLTIAAAGIMVGSSGVISISTEGSMSIDVVNDESAINYQSSDLTVRDGETTKLVTVTNRVSDDIAVTNTTIVDGKSVITTTTVPHNISPGERATIWGTVNCTPNKTQQITLTVKAEGSGITTQVSSYTETREFTVTCVASE